MTADTGIAPAPAAPAAEARPRRDRVRLRPGWITIAGKELADHLLSIRLYVLVIVLGVAALIPLYFVGEDVKSAASSASGYPAIFLYLFAYAPQGVNFGPISFTVQAFIAIAAPLLGVAFGFDAVNGERHQGTLPRLLSQPIHRDDVINGKFAGGLFAITIALVVVLGVMTGFGMLRLGIMPRPEEIVRLVAWLGLTVLYVSLWLAFGMLLSVVIRRAATSALVGFGVWLFVAMPFIGPLIVGLVGSFLASGATTRAEYASTIQWVARLLPGQVYAEASAALLQPTLTSISASEIYSAQAAEKIPGSLSSFDQSFLLIVPHIVILFALTVGCFALAYARFMRQEVRA
jgi:ABC-2 type transport system permease protein